MNLFRFNLHASDSSYERRTPPPRLLVPNSNPHSGSEAEAGTVSLVNSSAAELEAEGLPNGTATRRCIAAPANGASPKSTQAQSPDTGAHSRQS